MKRCGETRDKCKNLVYQIYHHLLTPKKTRSDGGCYVAGSEVDVVISKV